MPGPPDPRICKVGGPAGQLCPKAPAVGPTMNSVEIRTAWKDFLMAAPQHIIIGERRANQVVSPTPSLDPENVPTCDLLHVHWSWRPLSCRVTLRRDYTHESTI